jgi:tRNA dimethylallyltransferase
MSRLSSSRVLVLSGPTATGKSAIAIEIARLLGGEIVSADSVQLYKGLDIGSGKVTVKEMRGVPHHCIDVLRPSDDIGSSNAAHFSSLARSCISDIIARGSTPIVVGGSGMYLSFLLYGPPPTGSCQPTASRPLPVAADSSQSASSLQDGLLQDESEPRSSLCHPDASSSARLPHSNDAYRVKRRRDIEAATGSLPAYSGLLPNRHLLALDYNFICISMWCERVKSFRRIDLRVEQMICDGLLVEVLRLYGDGCLRPSSMAARAIGYRQALQFLAQHQVALLRDDWVDGFDCSAKAQRGHECSANAAMHGALIKFISSMQAATRQYSTRQLTWFKSDKRWLWFDTRPGDSSVDVSACAARLCRALACDPPASSPEFEQELPPLSKAEVGLLKYAAG